MNLSNINDSKISLYLAFQSVTTVATVVLSVTFGRINSFIIFHSRFISVHPTETLAAWHCCCLTGGCHETEGPLKRPSMYSCSRHAFMKNNSPCRLKHHMGCIKFTCICSNKLIFFINILNVRMLCYDLTMVFFPLGSKRQGYWITPPSVLFS